MRRIALVSDLHGNLPALEAVLDELAAEGIGEIVCLGDIAVGPCSCEVVRRVRELGCPVVRGNWDLWFLEGIPTPEDDVQARLAEIGASWAACLTDADREFLAGLLPTLEVDLGDGGTLFCYHGSPRSEHDWLFATTPDDALERMFLGRRATVFAGGHTHVQMLRNASVGLLVNPGSVGLPFTAWPPREVRVGPWAEYAVLEWGDGRLGVSFRRADYDVESLFEICRATDMPHADWWVGTWALETPPAATCSG